MLRLTLLLLGSALLTGCGLKGDLYLPDKAAAPVVTDSAAQSSTSSASSSSSS